MTTDSATVDTFVGPLTVTSDGRSIVRLEWHISAEATDAADPIPTEAAAASGPSVSIPAEAAVASDPILVEAVAQLRAYFDGRLGDFDLPVDFGQISDVARTVLTTLAEEVPAGTTVTYGQLAEASGTGIPARAVGGIMGLNPIPIIVPCHRVVAGDGLGGYSGGLPGHELETKRRLLEFEDALPQPLF
ncbi:methylated-DNA--[protein]-cysteine S-methyltransferase [Brevibacterium sediminis]|uniref:Methylated-DNA--protein-cysteine methyltransferase n=1 Tax=Brevibacterium sediminis TaxID=1857024 RepID=A0A5C4WZN0_9MICO|nr:methylated-DNA--[protein]-cysteine S-methyltransferase [Brevibacterium sediminis]TNM53994.1 methylated-DNA--[protein]-cysteine S-methyltransferase [Brevibacterium sediminis]